MSELARPEREDDMTKQIHHVTVIGAGGMGALFGAILSEGGLEVTLVDTNREHIDAIQKNGLGSISIVIGVPYQFFHRSFITSAVWRSYSNIFKKLRKSSLFFPRPIPQ